MEKDLRWEIIYDQINGMYVTKGCEGVRDETSEMGALCPLIEQAYAARDRLAMRLGIDPTFDRDFELLTSGFEDFSRACGKLMYHYGYIDGTNAK